MSMSIITAIFNAIVCCSTLSWVPDTFLVRFPILAQFSHVQTAKMPSEKLATHANAREGVGWGGGGGLDRHCWNWLIYKVHDEFSTCLSPFL